VYASANIRKEILRLLDEEFITLRGRTGTLAKRYPDLFGPNGAADFHWLTENDQPVSMLITRKVALGSRDETWRAAMVGWVHTVREKQGRGLASALLHAVAARMADEGMDALLLWAHQHAYYRAQGFNVADGNLLAESATRELVWSAAPKTALAEVALPDLKKSDLARLQTMADRDQRGGLPFPLRDPRRVPLPFDRVSMIVAGRAEAPTAYALAGWQAGWVTLLEGGGEKNVLTAIAASLAGRVANIRINARRGSALHQALAATLPFQPKPLAMYRPLSRRVDLFHAADWSFPYFDRM
jgi:GNAT superfamily N-acetyltransferase